MPLPKIKTCEVGVNLSENNWSERVHSRILRENALEDGECYIVFNNSRFWFGGGGGDHPPKARLFWMHGGMLSTVIPTVYENQDKQISAMLAFCIWFRKYFSCTSEMAARIDNLHNNLSTNLDDVLLKRAQAAQRRADREASEKKGKARK